MQFLRVIFSGICAVCLLVFMRSSSLQPTLPKATRSTDLDPPCALRASPTLLGRSIMRRQVANRTPSKC